MCLPVGRFYPQACAGDSLALSSRTAPSGRCLPKRGDGSRILGLLLRVAPLLVPLVVGVAAPASAGDRLYGYEDARGVLHFTNVNPDHRFKPLRKPRGLATDPDALSGPQTAYDPLILRASRRHGLPPALVKAVIRVESAFDTRAVSKKGAMGLMQLMPETAQRLGVHDAFAADQNVYGGAAYLRNLHDRYGSWSYTLAAYNAGPGSVDRYRGIPPFHETREYVRKVLSYYRQYHGDFAR